MLAGLLTSLIWFAGPKDLLDLLVFKVPVPVAPGWWAVPLQPPETANYQCHFIDVRSATRAFQLDAPKLQCGARRKCRKKMHDKKLDKTGFVYWMPRKLKKPTETAWHTTQRNGAKYAAHEKAMRFANNEQLSSAWLIASIKIRLIPSGTLMKPPRLNLQVPAGATVEA